MHYVHHVYLKIPILRYGFSVHLSCPTLLNSVFGLYALGMRVKDLASISRILAGNVMDFGLLSNLLRNVLLGKGFRPVRLSVSCRSSSRCFCRTSVGQLEGLRN